MQSSVWMESRSCTDIFSGVTNEINPDRSRCVNRHNADFPDSLVDYMRSINVGRPLGPIQRKMLLYGFVFVLGTGGVMLLVTDLHRPKQLLFPLIGIWGVLVRK